MQLIQSKDSAIRTKLVCRDSSSFVIKTHQIATSDVLQNGRIAQLRSSRSRVEVNSISNIKNNNEESDSSTSKIQAKSPIYIITVHQSSTSQSEQVTYVTNETLIKIDSLIPSTNYRLSVTALLDNQFSTVESEFSTLPFDYRPGAITSIEVIKYRTNQKNQSLVDGVISWKPAADRTCHYDILHYSSHLSDAQLNSIAILQPEDLYHYTISSLELNTEYEMAIRAKNTRISSLESELLWHTFHTPSCSEWHNNAQFCAPEVAENVQVSSTFLIGKNYTFNITWNKPRYTPEYYTIQLYDLNPTVNYELANSVSRNVSGNVTTVVIESFPMIGPQYEVLIAVHANNRSVTQSFIKLLYTGRYPPSYYTPGRITAIIVTPIVTILVAILLYTLTYLRMAKVKRFEQRIEYVKETQSKDPADPGTDVREVLQSVAPINDEMEINFEQIQLLDVLGEGAFGLVRKGILIRPIGTQNDVAVKMLKEFPSLEEIKEFRREIEVMKSVGTHPNIVCILGHYTQSVEDMMLLTEYCSEGNLLNYMRCEWDKLLKTKIFKEECRTPALETHKKPENVFNFNTSFVNEKKMCFDKSIVTEQSTGPNYENRLYHKLEDEEMANLTGHQNYSRQCRRSTYCEQNDTRQQSVVENQCYYLEKPDIPTITGDLLLDFARQIAVGMEFLARNKVVHRDLAARNVLVCGNQTVKISDFGLSRDIYQENLYRKTGSGKLPVKWLALESLTHQVYTSQSDVWSFGVLLYEICTLGANPYPLMVPNNLIAELRRGYRMEKPASCNGELYDLMLSCWSALPIDRPSFSVIQSRLEKLLEFGNNMVIDLDAVVDLSNISVQL
ncbi:tyrosine-protein kinase receptor torso-like [Malaya genurostris]|uniref:tyrosine-protein kinase receptor torso-like n=1 Tax=Malaya genurostris TaxID=325434 RepID=UPI0026F3EFB4|nr:tyrosine-protein kinase receptor torso-like [Malaya genurostris]